jgi:hybrid cluster-associated redox disulfide protein
MRAEELEDLSVSEIMKRWPATMRLFIDRRLLCVGCPIAPFHVLTDVSKEHGVDHDDLVVAVLEIANAGEARGVPASTRLRSARAHEGRRP